MTLPHGACTHDEDRGRLLMGGFPGTPPDVLPDPYPPPGPEPDGPGFPEPDPDPDPSPLDPEPSPAPLN